MKVMRENSARRTAWDVLILGLVLLSCTLVPYQIVFQGQAFRASTLLLYVVDLFFLLDIWLNFHTSYRQAGVEVTGRKEVGARYLKGLFPIDVIATFPIELVFVFYPDIAIGGKSLFVLLRVLRLFRVVRMFVIFRRWERMGWTNPGYLRITKFVGVISLLIHWLACGWFLSAAVAQFPPDCWVQRYGIGDAAPVAQYVRSLYWTITTMTTVGYGDITPARTVEYIVAMRIMLLGASMYAFIIGNVASLLSNLDSAKASYWHRMESATEYLRCRHAPRQLGDRVRNYYEYLWDRHRGLREDVFFADLPGPLRLDVLLHLTRELLDHVPLFRHCSAPLRNALLMALEARTYDPGSLVVQEGELGKDIYFVSQGELEVVKSGGATAGTLGCGDYFGDLSLILGETRTASARTTTYCEIFVLPEEEFTRIRKDYPEMRGVLKTMSSERSEKLADFVLDGIVL